MTRVLFYLLNSETPEARQAFACRLAEKAERKGNRVFIHTEDASQTAQVSKTLWGLRPESFIAHELQHEIKDQAVSPIVIGHEKQAPRDFMDLMINLNTEQPLFFSQFEHLAEIIDSTESIKKPGRERYQFYKDRGYHLQTHTIKS